MLDALQTNHSVKRSVTKRQRTLHIDKHKIRPLRIYISRGNHVTVLTEVFGKKTIAGWHIKYI